MLKIIAFWLCVALFALAGYLVFNGDKGMTILMTFFGIIGCFMVFDN